MFPLFPFYYYLFLSKIFIQTLLNAQRSRASSSLVEGLCRFAVVRSGLGLKALEKLSGDGTFLFSKRKIVVKVLPCPLKMGGYLIWLIQMPHSITLLQDFGFVYRCKKVNICTQVGQLVKELNASLSIFLSFHPFFRGYTYNCGPGVI